MFTISQNQMRAFHLPLRKKAKEDMLADLRTKGFAKVYEEENSIVIEDHKAQRTRLNFSETYVPEKIVTSSGLEYGFTFDADDNLTSFLFPGNEKIDFEYDKENLNAILLQRRRIGFHYEDKSTKINHISYPDGKTTKFNYANSGRLNEVINRGGEKTCYEEKVQGDKTINEIKDSLNRITLFETHKEKSDVRIVFADGSTQETFINEELGIEEIKLRDGKKKRTYYDGQYPSRIEYDDRSFILITQDGGQINALDNEEGKISYEYDTAKNTIHEAFKDTGTSAHYNADNIAEQIIYPSGLYVKYEFNEDDRCSGIIIDGQKYTLHYGKNGALSKINYPNGVTEEQSSSILNGIKSIIIKNPIGTELSSYTYEYDEMFRLSKSFIRNKSIIISNKIILYDEENRIKKSIDGTSGKLETYRYDKKGNMIDDCGVQRHIGKMDQIVSINNTSIGYDKAGNIISFYDEKHSHIKLVFNDVGTLESAKTKTEWWNYWYDALGRRIKKSNGLTTYVYSWFKNRLLTETFINLGQTSIREYIYIPYEDNIVPIGFIENGQHYALHSDQRGAVCNVTDPDGNIVWSALYNAFGNADISINKIHQPWRLIGHYYDEETALHYNYTRYYSPLLKSYLSIDPEWYHFEASNYSYSINNPFNRIDTYGNLSFGISFGIKLAGAIIGAILGGSVGTASGIVFGGATINNKAEKKELSPIVLPNLLSKSQTDKKTKTLLDKTVNDNKKTKVCIPCLLKKMEQSVMIKKTDFSLHYPNLVSGNWNLSPFSKVPNVDWTTEDAIKWKLESTLLKSNEYLFERKKAFILYNRDTIRDAAKQNNIPEFLLAGVAFNEYGGDPMWIDDTAYIARSFDRIGPEWVDKNLTVTKDPNLTSFGNLSIQVRRAAETLGYDVNKMSSEEKRALINKLKDPVQNIYIAAKHLASLKQIDFSDKGTNQLTDDDIKIIATRYNRGPDLPLDSIKKNLSYGNSIYKHQVEINNAMNPVQK